MRSISTAIISAILAYGANAHGSVNSVSVGGTQYEGYEPSNKPGSKPNPAKGVVWASNDYDIGFVSPHEYGSDSIICHKNASPAPKAAEVQAGGTISLSWPNWPDEEHPGVFTNYLAPAGTEEPSQIDKNSLQFFKISEFGRDKSVDPKGPDNGLATGAFKAAGKVAEVKIPTDIKPGLYVLRHEIIALHLANEADGTQNYPQCITINVSGSGTATPAGEPATAFYKANDPGILIKNFYGGFNPDTYVVPGPPVYDGSSSGSIGSGSTGTNTGSGTPTTTGSAKPSSRPSSGNSGSNSSKSPSTNTGNEEDDDSTSTYSGASPSTSSTAGDENTGDDDYPTPSASPSSGSGRQGRRRGGHRGTRKNNNEKRGRRHARDMSTR